MFYKVTERFTFIFESFFPAGLLPNAMKKAKRMCSNGDTIQLRKMTRMLVMTHRMNVKGAIKDEAMVPNTFPHFALQQLLMKNWRISMK